MQRDDPARLMSPQEFNQALIVALGLQGLKHVVGLTIVCNADRLPTVRVDTLVTQGAADAVRALIKSQHLELMEVAAPRLAPINVEEVLADRSAATANHRGLE